MHREPGLAATEKAIGEPDSRRSVNGCQRSHVFERRTPDLLAPAIVAAIIRANHYDAFSTCLDLSGPSRLFFHLFITSIPQQQPILDARKSLISSISRFRRPSRRPGLAS